jgi:plasmid stability protein
MPDALSWILDGKGTVPFCPRHVLNMSKMIQIRNVPDILHRKLKARAAMEGMSLSDYLMAKIRRSAERPSLRELRARLNKRRPISPKVPPAQAIREERDSR